jgi:hypothetical protein
MKLALTLFLPLFLFGLCVYKPVANVSSPEIKTALPDTIVFAKHVQPIMQKNCSPCHFTGGKMYERMPFDQDTTIINHQSGILKRIKDDAENAILKRFLKLTDN